jgi:hypothetical protein
MVRCTTGFGSISQCRHSSPVSWRAILPGHKPFGDHVESLISVLHRHHGETFTRAPLESMYNTTGTIRDGAVATLLDTAGLFIAAEEC